MTMKTKKTLQHIAAVAVVLLTLCLVFAAPVVAEGTHVAKVGDVGYTDIQEAIKAAAQAGTVEILADVTVDEWVMFAESLSIGSGQLITLEINGLTINGNGHKLTINSIESAGNGNYLFYDAKNLNINDLTITHTENTVGGIGLKAGTLDNVTIVGCIYGVFPQTGEVKIEDCTFKTTGTSIYFEEERDGLTVTGCTFENEEDANVILLRGDVTFTNNIIRSGRTVNVVSGSPIVSGNDFGDVRFKVYNSATATITGNEINVLEFNDATAVKSTFADNTMSEEAQAVLDGMTVAKIGATTYGSLTDAIAAAESDDTIILLKDVSLTNTVLIEKSVTLDLNGHVLTGVSGQYLKVTGNNVELVIDGTDDGSKIQNLRIALSNGENIKLTINGGIYEITGDCVLSSNGSEGNSYVVSVKDATLTSTDEIALYLPGAGTYSFENTKISGTTGIYTKAGELTLSGTTTVTGTAETYLDPVINNNGASSTGDAVVLDTNTDYSGAMKLYVKDSVVLSSANGYAIHENVTNSVDGTDSTLLVSISGGTITGKLGALAFSDLFNPKNATITGGTFSSNPSTYVASGYEVVQPGNSYLVQKYVDRSSSSSSSSTTEPEEPEQPEEPVVEPETPAAPGEATVETEVTDGGEVELETPAAEGEGGSAAADEDETKITGVVLPTGTDSEVTFVPVSEQPAPAGQEENTKKVFEINVPTYEKGKPATIKFTMTVAELAADGKEAADVALWHFDEETGEWTKLVTSYTIVDGVVYFEAITEDFSPFAIIYEDEPAGDMPGNEPQDKPETPESPAPVLGLLAALGAAVVLRRK